MEEIYMLLFYEGCPWLTLIAPIPYYHLVDLNFQANSVLEDPSDTQMFELQDTLQTPGVNNNQSSVGMTPKTLRLPKTGEVLLSVHGSPLGVFKEDNMEPIQESEDA